MSTPQSIPALAGERLDRCLAIALPQLSRSQVQDLIKGGHVMVDGTSVKPGIKMRGGESIVVTMPAPSATAPQAEAIPLHVLYEDADCVVLDKAAGMVVHPAAGNETGTLVNALLARYPEMAAMGEGDEDEEGRVGIVHRLDKDTSGLMVIARHIEALRALMTQFQERTVDKTYLALLDRTPKSNRGIVDVPIGRDPKDRKRMSVQANGRPAQTEFEVIDTDFIDGRALVRCYLYTGRTHQIRVHMAFIGCPVVGDRLYGVRKPRYHLNRQFLHAAELAFDQPHTGERLSFSSPLPAELQTALAALRPLA